MKPRVFKPTKISTCFLFVYFIEILNYWYEKRRNTFSKKNLKNQDVITKPSKYGKPFRIIRSLRDNVTSFNKKSGCNPWCYRYRREKSIKIYTKVFVIDIKG